MKATQALGYADHLWPPGFVGNVMLHERAVDLLRELLPGGGIEISQHQLRSCA